MAPKEPTKKDQDKAGGKLGGPADHTHPDKKNIELLAYRFIYYVSAALSAVAALAVFVLTAIIANAILTYTSAHGGRVAGLLVAAILSLVVLALLAYATYGLVKKDTKPAVIASLALLLIILAQTVLGCTVESYSPDDETELFESLVHLYTKSKVLDTKHVALYRKLESNLQCCGLFGPIDYRNYYNPASPPEIPMSCCPNYDPKLDDFQQENSRRLCKQNKSYYPEGCKEPANERLKNWFSWLQISQLVGVAFELFVLVLGLAKPFYLKPDHPSPPGP